MTVPKKENEKVIPFRFIPDREGKLKRIGRKDYLLMNDAFYTFFERSMGEFTDFFLAIKDKKKILGCRCTQCGIVRCPPFVTHCPDCAFAATEPIEVGQVGKLLSTPPITYFANSLFLEKAPFGRGRVTLAGADTALSVMLYTTSGILTPGIFNKDTEVKIIFRDNRMGEISDIFCVPTAELKPAQIRKKGLLESELNWASPQEPKYGMPAKDDIDSFKRTLKDLIKIAMDMNKSKRVRKAIEGWKRNIAVKCKAGEFAMYINDGDFKIAATKVKKPDFVIACVDPKDLLDCLSYKGAVTDAIILKKLWMSKNIEFNTAFKLDRMARALAREKKEAAEK
ncbi:MAG: hypothetical protein HYR55_17645 [Acidobacteria bacterium]|nr:hypothetical protein [Acidobacteriota bacterium]MBI3658541.1 hypothetical protein [Acidobacteriota bacterium]